MKKLFLCTTAVALIAAANPASAAEYLFGFDANQFSVSGTFTTADMAGADGGYDILNTTGTLTNTNNGNMFSLAGPTTFAGADNVLFADSDPKLSFDGTSFLVSNGLSVNLYYSAANNAYRLFTSDSQFIPVTNFTLTAVGGGVPEPAAWALLIGGFGFVGGAMRQRRQQRTSIRYA